MVACEFKEKMAESGIMQDEVRSELDMPIWSVVSFERCEASGLTYAEAAKRLAELEARKVTGLCLVTNETASHISN